MSKHRSLGAISHVGCIPCTNSDDKYGLQYLVRKTLPALTNNDLQTTRKELMANYRRANIKGGVYFFTMVTFRRQKFLCDENVRNALRNAIRDTRTIHPFTIDAWVLLPDHLHCIWTLPPNDAAFGVRWAMIKRFVTKQCAPDLHRDVG